MSKLLTSKQKASLAQMASRAYKHIQAQGCPMPSLAEWRHQETWAATERTESLTTATQSDYIAIYNRLAAYLGMPSKSDHTYQPMDKALHLLRDAMQRYETSPDYLAAIVRDQLKLECEGRTVLAVLRKSASVEHVRHLMYTAITRGRAEARRMQMETGQPTHEPHASTATMPPGGLADYFIAIRSAD